MSKPPTNMFQQLVDLLQGILGSFVTPIRERDFSRLLILVIAVLVFFFDPVIGRMKELFSNPPSLYVFYFSIFSLAVISIFLEVRKDSSPRSRLRPGYSWTQNHWIQYLIIALMSAFLTIGISSAITNLYRVDTTFEPDYHKCSERDCFSWGENILIDKRPAFDDDDSLWKRKCLTAWEDKLSGTDLFKDNPQQASQRFEKFIGSDNCPNDPEARIYRNNAKAQLEGNPIRIAVSVPISRKNGEGAFVSSEILRGVSLAQQQINENGGLSIGLKKRKLIVGILDDGPFEDQEAAATDPVDYERDVAGEAANFIVRNPNILGIIGHFTSDATESASEIYRTNDVIAISPTSTAVRKSNTYPNGVDFGDHYVFRTVPNDEIASKQLLTTIKGEEFRDSYTRVSVVYQNNSRYSQSFKDTFKKVYEEGGGEIVAESSGSCDFKGVGWSAKNCLEASEKASALLLIPSHKDSPEIDDILKGNNSFSLLGSDSMYDSKFLDEKTRGMIISVPWHRAETLAGLSAFESDANKVFGYKKENNEWETLPVNWRTAMSYDATQALSKGLTDASKSCVLESFMFWNQTIHPKCLRVKLRDVLSKGDFQADGALGSGSIQFDQQGDRLDTTNYDLAVPVQVCKQEDRYTFLRVKPDCL